MSGQTGVDLHIHHGRTYVKSPVASLCFVCSSVRNRVRVMISVLMASRPIGLGSASLPFMEVILCTMGAIVKLKSEVCECKGSERFQTLVTLSYGS